MTTTETTETPAAVEETPETEAVETESATPAATGDLSAYATKEPTPLHTHYVDWIKEKTGVEITDEAAFSKGVHLGVVLYPKYQRSPERAEAKIAEGEAREQAAAERREQAAKRAEEKAAKAKADAEKAAKSEATTTAEKPAPARKAPQAKAAASSAKAPF